MATPERLCDLVMKGGIASGVVYPPAILALKDHYRFRKIGGTSVGAIAAAGVAAAEYNRRRHQELDDTSAGKGFDELERTYLELGKGTALRDLFQPIPATKPLLDTLITVMEYEAEQKKRGRKPGALWRLIGIAERLSLKWVFSPAFILNVLLGLLVGFIIGFALPLGIFSLFPPESTIQVNRMGIALTIGAIFALIGLGTGAASGIVIRLARAATSGLRRNNFGTCTGYIDIKKHPKQAETVLTGWLSKTLDRIAGLNEGEGPLTFAHLYGQQDRKGQKEIELQMVSSNLSHGIPYVLPDGLHNYLFKIEDMEKLFPQYVVDHMLKHQPGAQDSRPELVVPATALPDNIRYFPLARDLPVAVAVRLSLSYPVLLSAMPLYTVNMQAAKEVNNGAKTRLEPADFLLNWFSDGGICSNFPIHFFDRWLPRYPTFGINLTPITPLSAISALEKPGALMDPKMYEVQMTEEEKQWVYLPRPEETQAAEWQQITGSWKFLMTIVGTSMNYRDTMQTGLPGYRERSVQIRLEDDEGGLNLMMEPEMVKKMYEKGKEAGMILRPSPEGEFNFDHHWWTRFLVLMDQIEENSGPLREAMNPTNGLDVRQRLEIESCSDPSEHPYYRNADWCQEAERYANDLHYLVARWQNLEQHRGAPFFAPNAPEPDPVLRLTPEI